MAGDALSLSQSEVAKALLDGAVLRSSYVVPVRAILIARGPTNEMAIAISEGAEVDVTLESKPGSELMPEDNIVGHYDTIRKSFMAYKGFYGWIDIKQRTP